MESEIVLRNWKLVADIVETIGGPGSEFLSDLEEDFLQRHPEAKVVVERLAGTPRNPLSIQPRVNEPCDLANGGKYGIPKPIRHFSAIGRTWPADERESDESDLLEPFAIIVESNSPAHILVASAR